MTSTWPWWKDFSKIFEKLVNRLVDHLEKCGLFSDYQQSFRSSQSTADLLTVLPDRIARAFNRSGAARAVALDISKAFDRVWHVGFLHKHESYKISGQIFSVIDGFKWFCMGSLQNNIRLMLEFLKFPFLVLHFSYCVFLPDDVISDIAIYADNTTPYF